MFAVPKRNACLAAALAGGIAFAVPASAQTFSYVSLPIPVIVDARPVNCPLYLKLQMKRYNQSFERFAAGPTDKPQAMFVTAVQAIRSRDTAKFASVWTSPDQMKKPSDAVTVTLTDNSSMNWIDVARNNFDFDHITMLAEIFAGPDTIFVFETPNKFGPRRMAFYVGPDRKNQPRLSAVSSNVPVLALIKSAFDAGAMPGGQAYEPKPNVNLPYQVAIPLAGKGGGDAHAVYFEFAGSPMDFPVGDARAKPPSPVLQVLRNAAHALRKGTIGAFASYYTPRSGQIIKQWLMGMKQHAQGAVRPGISSTSGAIPGAAGTISGLEANVKFVLDAAPVFLVFQSAAPGDKWAPESLSYSYVVEDAGSYKIANFSASDDLDEFLQDPALFDKNVLKSSPAANRPAGKIPNLR